MKENLEYRKLIEDSIENNPHSKNNEDLFEDFFNESTKRLQTNMQILGEKIPPKTYMEKVINTAMLKVLKDTGRLKRKKQESQEFCISEVLSYNVNEYGEIAFNIPYPHSDREKNSVIYEQLSLVTKNLEKLNENEPEKLYTKLFELRYDKKLKLSEISDELRLSEAETVNRFFELLVKLNSYY